MTQPADSIGAGRQPIRVQLLLAVARREAEEAIDAQSVLGNARRSVANETHDASAGIFGSAQRIIECAVRRAVKRIEGEVATARILGPVAAEGHDRPPTVGLDIAAQR